MELKDIKFDKKNYRKHSDSNKALIKKSITETGLGRSVVIDSENELIAGNGVVSQLPEGTPIRVIETDGSELVVVKRTDLKTKDEKRKKLALMDNSASDQVEWDFDNLSADFDLSELPEFGIEDLPEVAQLDTEITEDEVPSDEQVETRVKKGDIWQLGDHRLMCGDSTVITDVEKLMGGEKADMVLSDPPYGMHLDTDFSDCIGSIGRKNSTRGNKYKSVIGDNDDFSPDLITTFFNNFDYVKEMFLFGADYFAELLPNKNNGSWLVWDKRKESQADAIGSEFELIWSKNKHKRRMLRFDWFGFLSSKDAKDARNRVHPTQKPVSLLAEIIKQWGNNLQIIVDLFGGSGSTLIACEQLNRKCRMMELDEHYCSVIIQRYINLKGNAEDVFLLNQDGTKTKYEDVINAKGRKAA